MGFNINNTGSLSDGGIKLNYTGYYFTIVKVSGTNSAGENKPNNIGVELEFAEGDANTVGIDISAYLFNSKQIVTPCKRIITNSCLHLTIYPYYKITNGTVEMSIQYLG